MPKSTHLKISAEERADFERAALDTLRAIAQSTEASPATRSQAARAILEALRPGVRPQRERTAAPAPTRTPAELRAELELVRKKRNTDA